MATALHTPTGPNLSLNGYPQALSFAELDFQDSRYPPPRPLSAAVCRYPFPASRNSSQQIPDDVQPIFSDNQSGTTTPPAWTNTPDRHERNHLDPYWSDANASSQQQLSRPRNENMNMPPHALPPGAAPLVIERYSMGDNSPRPSSFLSGVARPSAVDSNKSKIAVRSSGVPQVGHPALSTPGRSPDIEPIPSSAIRKLPVVEQSSRPASDTASSQTPPPIPLPATPSYSSPMAISISPQPRAYAQQPTYITPPSAPDPLNPVFSPAPSGPPEEVCMECAMRDQDMADVDVASPGVWDRDSDVLYDELVQREREDKLAGIASTDPSRPRAMGGRLTEANLKFWLSVNPREPASRQQTLEKYIKSQRKLLEANAIAQVRAMQESQRLDNKMREAYSQLRRSAYAPSHSRDVTLLENGMIVEHVDVRKEEKEARERRRKEERRARKSSRGSAVDVTSLYSVQSLNPPESVPPVRPSSRYSPSSSPRPSSVLTNPNLWDRPNLPRAYSQVSFSDVHSLGSASPRRTRFFGMKNLSTGWRSQDSLAPSGMSGSMIDMHLALQREAGHLHPMAHHSTQPWPPRDIQILRLDTPPEDKPKKKPGGLKKIWRLVTGSSKSDPQTFPRRHMSLLPSERHEDDSPLAPPPPLSYLVDRGPSDMSQRHSGTSQISVKNVGLSMSPPTAPSSNLPSPASSGRSAADREVVIEGRKVAGHETMIDNIVVTDQGVDDSGKKLSPIVRHRVQSSPSLIDNQMTNGSRPVSVVVREKSLPPLPHEPLPAGAGRGAPMGRPITVFAYDQHRVPINTVVGQTMLQPQPGFRSTDGRRQSFGGMTTRPNMPQASLPFGAMPYTHTLGGPGSGYDEFGYSQPSLGRSDSTQKLSAQSTGASGTKRKSRFGLPSIFGRKPSASDHQHSTLVGGGGGVQDFGGLPLSDSMTLSPEDGSGLVHATLRESTVGRRVSVVSRKALEEVVELDPEFIAYRYPSNDQPLDLFR